MGTHIGGGDRGRALRAGWPAVLVTRAAEQASSTAARLAALGFGDVTCVPAIELHEVEEESALATQLRGLARCDWLILTSANAAARVARLGPRPLPPAVQIAAVGPATARAIEAELGRRADLLAPTFRAEELADALLEAVGPAPRALMLVRAEQARDVLPERLRAAGHRLEVVVCYAVRAALQHAPALGQWRRQHAHAAHKPWVILASSRSVDAFLAQADELGWSRAELAAALRFAAISPLTAQRLRHQGLVASLVPAEFTLDALCEELAVCALATLGD